MNKTVLSIVGSLCFSLSAVETSGVLEKYQLKEMSEEVQTAIDFRKGMASDILRIIAKEFLSYNAIIERKKNIKNEKEMCPILHSENRIRKSIVELAKTYNRVAEKPFTIVEINTLIPIDLVLNHREKMESELAIDAPDIFGQLEEDKGMTLDILKVMAKELKRYKYVSDCKNFLKQVHQPELVGLKKLREMLDPEDQIRSSLIDLTKKYSRITKKPFTVFESGEFMIMNDPNSIIDKVDEEISSLELDLKKGQ
jgi:hypothetical protein